MFEYYLFAGFIVSFGLVTYKMFKKHPEDVLEVVATAVIKESIDIKTKDVIYKLTVYQETTYQAYSKSRVECFNILCNYANLLNCDLITDSDDESLPRGYQLVKRK